MKCVSNYIGADNCLAVSEMNGVTGASLLEQLESLQQHSTIVERLESLNAEVPPDRSSTTIEHHSSDSESDIMPTQSKRALQCGARSGSCKHAVS